MFATKNQIRTSATRIANVCEPQKPTCTALRMSVVLPTLLAAGRASIVPSVAHR